MYFAGRNSSCVAVLVSCVLAGSCKTNRAGDSIAGQALSATGDGSPNRNSLPSGGRATAPATPPLPPTTGTAERSASPGIIWEGTSGGIRIRWTESDVTAEVDNARDGARFSAASLARGEYDKELGESATNANPCRLEDEISVLSVVGPIISLEHATYSECARSAHPGGETRYASLDLSSLRSGKTPTEARLTSYFAPPAVFEALRKDSVVRKALRPEIGSPQTRGAPPGDLEQLLKRLADVQLDEPCAVFPDDLLIRFAFHHRDQSRLAIRVGLPGSGPCRQKLTALGLEFSTPEPLSEMVASAETRREGFLMKDASAIARGRKTELKFGSSPEAIEAAREAEP